MSQSAKQIMFIIVATLIIIIIQLRGLDARVVAASCASDVSNISKSFRLHRMYSSHATCLSTVQILNDVIKPPLVL
eukprot:6209344-Pleurochrysis_carterae.AAC.2